VEIRELREDEWDEAGRVTAEAYDEFVAEDDPDWDEYHAEIGDVRGRAERATVLGAFGDGQILGTATVEFDRTLSGDPLPPDVARLRMLGVAPAARGRGVGRALVEAANALAVEHGRSAMLLHTTDLMKTALALYEDMGFVRDPERDRVFEDGFVLVAYRLAL
jgi:ribosomal protein S18 acetylase RimI-like enzyme